MQKKKEKTQTNFLGKVKKTKKLRELSRNPARFSSLE